MTSLGHWIGVLWPIATTLTPMLLLGGFFWLKSQFASVPDLEAVRKETREINERQVRLLTRLDTVTAEATSSPTRHELALGIASLGERTSRVEAGVEAVQRELGTQNAYLRALLEKGMQR